MLSKKGDRLGKHLASFGVNAARATITESESGSVVSNSLQPHGILQARILEWIAFPFSRGSSNPRIEPRSPTLQADSLPVELQGKPNTGVGSLSLLQWIFLPQQLNRGILQCRWIFFFFFLPIELSGKAQCQLK